MSDRGHRYPFTTQHWSAWMIAAPRQTKKEAVAYGRIHTLLKSLSRPHECMPQRKTPHPAISPFPLGLAP